MPKLQIGNNVVEVGDEFNSLSPEDQQKTVNEIASKLGPSQDKPDPKWSDVPGLAAQNLVPSTGKAIENFAGGVGHAIAHPIDTLESMASLGTGEATRGLQAILPQGAQDYLNSGALGNAAKLTPQNPRDQQALDAADSFNAGIKNDYYDHPASTLAYNPGKVLSDAAQLALLRKAPKVAKAAPEAIGKAVTKVGETLSPEIKIPHPEVAGNVAEDLKNLGAQGQDIASLPEVKPTLAKLHEDYLTEANSLLPHVEERLGGKVSPLSLIDEEGGVMAPHEDTAPNGLTQAQLMARQAIKSSRNLAKSTATPEQINALHSVVGDTQQGARLVQLQKQIANVQNLRRLGQGGVSQVTDQFNPLNHNWTVPNLVAGAYFGHAPATIAAQATLYGAGRAIDAVTGRRVLANKWLKQNAETAPQSIPSGLEDLRVTKAQKIADTQKAQEAQSQLASQAKAQQQAQALAQKQQAANEKASALQDYRAATAENKARDKAQKAQAKTEQAATVKAQKKTGGNLDDSGKVIKNQANYDAGKNRVTTVYDNVQAAADKAPTPTAKKALTNFAEDAASQTRGNTVAFNELRKQLFTQHLSKLKTPKDKAYFKQHAEELRVLFEKRKK